LLQKDLKSRLPQVTTERKAGMHIEGLQVEGAEVGTSVYIVKLILGVSVLMKRLR